MICALFILFTLIGQGLHAMENQLEGPKPVEIEVLQAMLEVNSLTGRSHVLALHISMAKGAHHFPLFETHFHAAENNVKKGINALSMAQEDPTRATTLLENLNQLRESRDNLSPIVKKMETLVRHKICKQAFSYRAPSIEATVQALVDHINNAPH